MAQTVRVEFEEERALFLGFGPREFGVLRLERFDDVPAEMMILLPRKMRAADLLVLVQVGMRGRCLQLVVERVAHRAGSIVQPMIVESQVVQSVRSGLGIKGKQTDVFEETIRVVYSEQTRFIRDLHGVAQVARKYGIVLQDARMETAGLDAITERAGRLDYVREFCAALPERDEETEDGAAIYGVIAGIYHVEGLRQSTRWGFEPVRAAFGFETDLIGSNLHQKVGVVLLRSLRAETGKADFLHPVVVDLDDVAATEHEKANDELREAWIN